MGNYLLLEELWEGSYSKVYGAKHRYLEHEVALKLLDYTEIFERELKSLRRLNHSTS